VSPANIYKFLSSKEALVQDVADWNLSQFKVTISKALKKEKRERQAQDPHDHDLPVP
jgi:AcrR family transcriptional regulator